VNDSTGAYSSADGVASAARQLLNTNDLAWLRTETRLTAPTLAVCDIGKRSYVGDIVTKWMLVYGPQDGSGGAVVHGSTSGAIVAMSATPHDKAVAAAKTFIFGYTLRDILCLVREDKHATERRLDQESRASEQVELISEADAQTCNMLCSTIASLANVRGRDVFAGAWNGCALAPNPEVKGAVNMTPEEGRLVIAWLRRSLESMKAKQAASDDQSQKKWAGDPSEVADVGGYAPDDRGGT
jgi:hypothetical protein